MGYSVLVFISHASEDKETYIEPIIRDLEDCYINVWVDKKRIVPGDSIRKSIFGDGLDKADVVLIFFTQQSLSSSWVDQEIKHVLREQKEKGNNFDLDKIISIFDSEETHQRIKERYPELTDNLLHLMPAGYDKTQLGQLISAIWSKYLSLQGGNTEVQKQLLDKDKEIIQKEKQLFEKEKENQELRFNLQKAKNDDVELQKEEKFLQFLKSGKIDNFIRKRDILLSSPYHVHLEFIDLSYAIAFRLIIITEPKTAEERCSGNFESRLRLTELGYQFFQWLILYEAEKSQKAE